MDKRLLRPTELQWRALSLALGLGLLLGLVSCGRSKSRSDVNGGRLQVAITLPPWEPAERRGLLSLLDEGPGYAPMHLALRVESAKGVHFKGVVDLKNPLVSLDAPLGAVQVSAAFLAVPLQPGQTLKQYCELRRSSESGAFGSDPILTSVAGGKFEITANTEELPLRFEALKLSAWKPLPLVMQMSGARAEGKALFFRDGISGQAIISPCESEPTAVEPDDEGRLVLNVPLVDPPSLLRLSKQDNDFDFLPELVKVASGTRPLPHRVDLALRSVVPVADTFDFFGEDWSVRRKLEQGFSLLRPVPSLAFTPDVRPIGIVRLKLDNRAPFARYLCSSEASMQESVDCLERFQVLLSPTQSASQRLPVFVRVEDAEGLVSKTQALVLPLPPLPGKPQNVKRSGTGDEANLTWEPVDGALFYEAFLNVDSKPLTTDAPNLKLGGSGMPITTAVEVRVRAVNALGRGDFEILRNAAPRAPVVSLGRSNAGNASTLTCAASGSTDAEGDPVTYAYSWFRNGSVVAGQTVATLAGPFVQGDSFICKASAGDGTANSELVASASVTIENIAPTAPSLVSLTPPTAGSSSMLTCAASGSTDADGDATTYITYWYKGVALMNGQTASTLAGQFVKGDSITCKVQASDGTLSSGIVESNTLTIQNSAPSAPATATITASAPTRASTFNCGYGGGSDHDNDALTPIYVWYVNGAAVNGQTSSTLSGLNPAVVVGGIVVCSVALNDGTTTSAATASAGLAVQNTPPTLSAIENMMIPLGEIGPTIAFTIEDIDSTLACSASSLSVTSNSNTTLIPPSNISFAGIAPNCTTTLSPAANQTGTSSLTLQVSDGTLTAQRTFTFSVDRRAPLRAFDKHGAPRRRRPLPDRAARGGGRVRVYGRDLERANGRWSARLVHPAGHRRVQWHGEGRGLRARHTLRGWGVHRRRGRECEPHCPLEWNVLAAFGFRDERFGRCVRHRHPRKHLRGRVFHQRWRREC